MTSQTPNEEEKKSDAYQYSHNLMNDDERIRFVRSCLRLHEELPPSPYQMRVSHPVTQKQLDDTEREYQRIKKDKDERLAQVEMEKLRRENIIYTCECGTRMQHNGVRNHQTRLRCPNCGHTKTVS